MTFDLFTIVIKEEVLTIDINHAFDSITITIEVIPATINFVESITVKAHLSLHHSNEGCHLRLPKHL